MGKFTEVTAAQLRGTLARKLVPTADSLRDLLTRFGLRTYKVSVIRIQWSGGDRGVGTPVVLRETVLLPTPKVEGLSSLTELIQPIGMNEEGGIDLTKISATYTDEDLRGLSAQGEEIPPDEEVFYEIEFPRLDGGPSLKRRFQLRGAPQFRPGGLQWSVRLEKSNDNRDRRGDP